MIFDFLKKKDKEPKFDVIGELDKKLEEVKKWHKDTFPDATHGSQLLKLEEEIGELIRAEGQKQMLEEYADVLIVCAGLRRWDSFVGISQYNSIVRSLNDHCLGLILDEVGFKLEKNRQRKWRRCKNGTYHHTTTEKRKRG